MARDPWLLERIEPMRLGLRHGRSREHVARYRFAAERVRGRVLDAGCGSGYGSLMLAAAPMVREVVGIDRDARSLAWARRFYGGPRVRYEQAELGDGRLARLGRFDAVVCLEVLEHLHDPEGLLARLDGLLAPGGALIVSTPLGAGRAAATRQPHHAFQLRREEFTALLRPRFDYRLFGQRHEQIESWRAEGRYFLMLAVCRSRCGEGESCSAPCA
jgi:2-polyprenyl-3-methyl-5-hydroxy-6-metoxy-1,4-benzoquinol methylase